jgi:diacylglycerol kinase
MMKRLYKHTISFKHAFDGIIWSLKTQPNYQVHLILSILAVGAGFYYQISYYEFLTIIILISVGLALETVNTAIENAADAIDTSWREDLKHTKDVAAGAMLLFAIGAFIVACIIFLPKMF